MDIQGVPEAVTVVISAHNDLRNIWEVFYRLEPNAQSLPLRIFVCCTVPNLDNLDRYMEVAALEPHKWPACAFPEFRVFPPVRDTGVKDRNITEAYSRMLPEVKTPYVLFQDADTWPCIVGNVAHMVECLESEPSLGIVGTVYQQASDHVPMGSSVMPTAIAQDIDWPSLVNPEGCFCRALCHQELARRGHRAEFVGKPGLRVRQFARHRKREE